MHGLVNNGAPANGKPSITVGVNAEMWAYDMLPPVVRDALKVIPFDLSAYAFWQQCLNGVDAVEILSGIAQAVKEDRASVEAERGDA